MKIILLFTFFFLISANTFSQPLWRLLPNSPGITGSGRFEDVYFVNSNTGWIVDYSGIAYKTTNGGNTWDVLNTSGFGLYFRSVGFFDENTGMIGTLNLDSNKILLRTTNGGLNFTAVSNISGLRPQGICGISIVNTEVAYACGRYYGSARIIKTTDKGNSWKLVFNDPSKARTLIDCYFWTPDSGIAVGGSLPDLDGNAVIIKTTDGGNSWQKVFQSARTDEWCWKISFINRNIGYVSIERGGFANILKTTDNGNNWTEIPFRDYEEEGIGFVNENTGWVGGWTGPTYQTTNGGSSWFLAGWGTNVNRFRFLNDTLAYSVGDRVYKYSANPVGINLTSSEIPSSFNLYQNYPNPFNPVTKIKFDLPSIVNGQTSNVKLIVYNALGKEVQTIVNEKLSPGSYEVEFNGENLSSGMYFYRMETNKFTDTKRMILIK